MDYSRFTTQGDNMTNRKARKGRCYECALSGVSPEFATDDVLRECAAEVLVMSSSFGEPTLCHGWPTLTAGAHAGRVYGHAWIEYEAVSLALDVVSGSLIPINRYYEGGRIDPDWVSRYTPKHAAAAALETGVYGPWDDGPEGAL